ncbi:MAG: Uma2 family endonuclease [Aggregatilineales bacterium]
MATVTQTPTAVRITTHDFFKLPESMLPVELIDGEIIMSPAPELVHQDTTLNLAVFLKHRATSGHVYVAPVDVELDEHNVLQPDVLWVAPDSLCKAFEGKRFRGGPDFVAEVLSPTSGARDRKKKFRLYEKFGTREYWIIDPIARLIEVWTRVGDKLTRIDVFEPGEQIASPLFGAVDVNAIFPNNAPA